jgi:hypothetical protein
MVGRWRREMAYGDIVFFREDDDASFVALKC